MIFFRRLLCKHIWRLTDSSHYAFCQKCGKIIKRMGISGLDEEVDARISRDNFHNKEKDNE
jgi:hypothetical protein